MDTSRPGNWRCNSPTALAVVIAAGLAVPWTVGAILRVPDPLHKSSRIILGLAVFCASVAAIELVVRGVRWYLPVDQWPRSRVLSILVITVVLVAIPIAFVKHKSLRRPPLPEGFGPFQEIRTGQPIHWGEPNVLSLRA